jgi:hypothetical protein
MNVKNTVTVPMVLVFVMKDGKALLAHKWNVKMTAPTMVFVWTLLAFVRTHLLVQIARLKHVRMIAVDTVLATMVVALAVKDFVVLDVNFWHAQKIVTVKANVVIMANALATKVLLKSTAVLNFVQMIAPIMVLVMVMVPAFVIQVLKVMIAV